MERKRIINSASASPYVLLCLGAIYLFARRKGLLLLSHHAVLVVPSGVMLSQNSLLLTLQMPPSSLLPCHGSKTINIFSLSVAFIPPFSISFPCNGCGYCSRFPAHRSAYRSPLLEYKCYSSCTAITASQILVSYTTLLLPISPHRASNATTPKWYLIYHHPFRSFVKSSLTAIHLIFSFVC